MAWPYYYSDDTTLYWGDCCEVLRAMPKESVDMIFADPPYFLSNGGMSVHSGKRFCVDKGDWDKDTGLQDKHNFNREWISLAKDILKVTGTIWISGTFHNIFSVGMALEEIGFKILNNITWQKTNPPPNLGCRQFTHSTETILWAKKDDKKAKHYFNYELMKSINGSKQMKDVWEGPLTPAKEKTEGKHPTQKPLYLLNRIIQASTQEGDLILDPFLGSGTTGVSAKALGRKFIGIEQDLEYVDLAMRRIQAVQTLEDF